ncbi:MAG: amidohydrolase family protein [Trueperaceae bacterium]|nr:amidohydrolase family protein [Trueperaceae bacterium]
MADPISTPSPRPFVVDAHAHVLPYLGGPAGFASTGERLLYAQRAMHTHGAQPARRMRDHARVETKTLWDQADPGPSGRRAVDFRAGRFGRYEWRVNGEDHYVQFMPPSLQTMEAPPDFMIAQMDYAGIDVAVLQNDHIYGSLNEYFAAAALQHPGRFVGLAQVEEPLAYQDEQIARLRDAVLRLGMRGLYFTTSTFFTSGYRTYYTDDAFTPFWDVVRDLGLSVFFVFSAASPIGGFDEEMRRFRAWLDRYPSVPTVLVHGLPDGHCLEAGGRLVLPDPLRDALGSFPIHAEVLFPIKWGGIWDYPYPQAMDLLRQYIDLFGATRLVWGSDMPNVERYCTYRQSLTYVRDYADFLSADDLSGILGGNALGLLRPDQA